MGGGGGGGGGGEPGPPCPPGSYTYAVRICHYCTTIARYTNYACSISPFWRLYSSYSSPLSLLSQSLLPPFPPYLPFLLPPSLASLPLISSLISPLLSQSLLPPFPPYLPFLLPPSLASLPLISFLISLLPRLPKIGSHLFFSKSQGSYSGCCRIHATLCRTL